MVTAVSELMRILWDQGTCTHQGTQGSDLSGYNVGWSRCSYTPMVVSTFREQSIWKSQSVQMSPAVKSVPPCLSSSLCNSWKAMALLRLLFVKKELFLYSDFLQGTQSEFLLPLCSHSPKMTHCQNDKHIQHPSLWPPQILVLQEPRVTFFFY